MVMMMVVMMVMIIAAMMVVVVMMVMVVILRDLFSALRLRRGGPRVIYRQRIQRIGNWLQKVAITGRWRVFCGCGKGGLCAAHCRQRSRSAQKRGDLLIHLFSSWPQPKAHGLLVTITK
jgi:hypothetical protein